MLRTAHPMTWRTVPRLAGVAAGMTALLAIAACGATDNNSTGGGGGGGTQVSLTAMDFSFSPNQLNVPAGATVTVNFTNNGHTTHSFTLDNGNASQDASAGSSTTVTFTAPQSGTLTFHCKYHPTQMMGTITIGGSGGSGAGGGSSTSNTSSSSSSSTGGGYGY